MRWFNKQADVLGAVASASQGLDARLGLVARQLDAQAGQLSRQDAQMRAVSRQVDDVKEHVTRLDQVLDTIKILAVALHAKGDTLRSLQDQASVALGTVQALAAALHDKGDTLRSSQDQSRVMLESVQTLAAALHSKADMLQASQNQLRELAAASHGDMRDLSEVSQGVLQGLAHAPGATKDLISGEIDRLDMYIAYHARAIRDDLTAAFHASSKGAPTFDTPTFDTLYSAPDMDAILRFGGYDVVVPTREIGLLGYLRRHGMEAVEPAVRAALRRRLRPGHVAVDAGANIGLHSIVMAEAVGPGGRLVAFEPLPHLAAAVSRSLLLNGFAGRCDVVQAALADVPGEAVIHAAAHSPLSSMFARDGLDARPVTVPRTSLDAHVPPGGRVDLVKMDIEGAEPLAWAGMARVVAENPGLAVILEWSASHFAQSGHSAAGFMQAIQAAGFSAWSLCDTAPDEPVRLDPADAPALEGGNLLLHRD